MNALDKVFNKLSEAEDAISSAEFMLSKMGDAAESGHEAALDAINQIRRGAYNDAITTLEREFLPKFASSADAQVALLKHKAGAK